MNQLSQSETDEAASVTPSCGPTSACDHVLPAPHLRRTGPTAVARALRDGATDRGEGADVRGDQYARRGPERMPGRERLGVSDVEGGPQAAAVHLLQQRVGADDRAQGHVDEQGAVLDAGTGVRRRRGAGSPGSAECTATITSASATNRGRCATGAPALARGPVLAPDAGDDAAEGRQEFLQRGADGAVADDEHGPLVQGRVGPGVPVLPVPGRAATPVCPAGWRGSVSGPAPAVPAAGPRARCTRSPHGAAGRVPPAVRRCRS